MGTQPPPQQGTEPPIFVSRLLWPNAGWIKMPLGPNDIVLHGNPAPHQRKGHSPQFSAHVYCGQMVVCIRIALGTEVGLNLGDIVLDGVAAFPPKRGTAPQFSVHVCCGQTVTTWYGSRPRPRPHCVRRGSSSPAKGAQQPSPSFRRMSIVAMVVHLSYCCALVCIYVLLSV